MHKYKSHPSLPLINSEDDETWKEAVALIQQLNLRVYRPNRWQLKIGTTSFYPGKGTIYVDGDTRALPDRGLPALIRLLTGGRTSAPNHTPTGGDGCTSPPRPSPHPPKAVPATNKSERSEPPSSTGSQTNLAELFGGQVPPWDDPAPDPDHLLITLEELRGRELPSPTSVKPTQGRPRS